MEYSNIKKAKFIVRPNRFIARVELDGEEVVCHVKNTGRCKELLVPGATVLLYESDNPARKTKYDLISVYKGKHLINMDSQAPNQLFSEWVQAGGLFQNVSLLRREVTHGDSRFDFYIEADGKKAFVEVKGVTLEEDGVVRFPDAPTERGIKHLNGLVRCVEEGYDAYAVFVIQMSDVKHFEPNEKTHPAFGEALRRAAKAGVRVLAYDCRVAEGKVAMQNPVEVRL